MKKITLIALGLLGWAQAEAQSILGINNHADCEQMLTIETVRTIGPTTAPDGPGEVIEFQGNQRTDKYFMEQEGHTVWYQFEAKSKGQLTFELEPLDSLNDYDFAVYKYTDEGFCEAVRKKEILPIRTNFSRNKIEIGGKTGLTTTALDELVPAGINPAYSKALDVRAKEQYVLLVNNVYDNGSGHLLHFNYLVNMNLSGLVLDAESESVVEADVTLTNVKTGRVLAQAKTDTVGAYTLNIDLSKSELNDKMHLEISKEGYFFQDTLMKAFDMATKMRNVRIKTRIRKIKKGDSFVVKNILFYSNSSKPMPNALPSIKSLFKTMKRNKKLKIMIEDHTNGCPGGVDSSMKLSNSRAKTVMDYLLENNISKERIQSRGYGCTRMLYSNERGRYAHLNRRVEIKVLDL